ncbi:putative outer mitochondrial membrane protein porin [Rozella allomycis CSF55]|uniref:Putative outer mitochondrial membrane protein porin n=1 Tax=Rozella allomycis (strain CSF55) TaxID=988480 RepID=A0A4P9YEV0_ROZAC|nr:putative outer mitochondrial membrane protein porin [Rozella allomycis CSF55]
MSTPAKFNDLAKSANDLLNKDFAVGFLIADLKHKYNAPDSVAIQTIGLAVTSTVSTNGALSEQVEFNNALFSGLKFDLFGSFLQNGKHALRTGVEYKQDYVTTTASADILKGPTISADIVVGSDGVYAGSEVGYDVQSGTLTKYNAATAYNGSNYTVSLHALNSFKTFTASYFHRVNSTVEAGGKATWNYKSDKESDITVEVASKYTLDKDSYMKTKLDSVGKLGLSYTQNLRRGVKITLAGLFDTYRLQENAHKIGLNLVFEA